MLAERAWRGRKNRGCFKLMEPDYTRGTIHTANRMCVLASGLARLHTARIREFVFRYLLPSKDSSSNSLSDSHPICFDD